MLFHIAGLIPNGIRPSGVMAPLGGACMRSALFLLREGRGENNNFTVGVDITRDIVVAVLAQPAAARKPGQGDEACPGRPGGCFESFLPSKTRRFP